MLDSIVVKVTSTAAFFGEPSVIRVILEKMIPGALGQSDRDIMFIHRKVEEQPTSIAIEIHETGTQSAVKLIEHYLRILMDNPKLTFAVYFMSTNEDGPQTSFAEIVASTEATKALGLHFRSILASSEVSEVVDFAQDSEEYFEARLDALLAEGIDFENMSEQKLALLNTMVDDIMGIKR